MQSGGRRSAVRKIVVAGVLGAIITLLGYLGPAGPGFIPVPTPAGHATTLHVPVIIGGILEGPIVGLVLGLMFGIFSMVQAVMVPSPLTAPFLDPLVAVLPRLFIGITAWAAYVAFRRTGKYAAMTLAGCLLVICGAFVYWALPVNVLLAATIGMVLLALIAGFVYLALRENREVQALILSAAVGTLTNTILVLTMAVVRGYLPPQAALAAGVLNGIPEVIVACIIVVAVVGIWKGVETRRTGSTV
ncbi:MAG TPA: ECF transporter S component [Anaerolineae bacterium]|nr:ECF transporter S component [Anaerolineae bacterium]